jgi:hypothetical protein
MVKIMEPTSKKKLNYNEKNIKGWKQKKIKKKYQKKVARVNGYQWLEQRRDLGQMFSDVRRIKLRQR